MTHKDKFRTSPYTLNYAEGWDRIFSIKKQYKLLNDKWKISYKFKGSDPGKDYYDNQIVSPEGIPITVSRQIVITGEIKYTPIGDGFFNTEVVKKYDNTGPVVCLLCESMILKLNS